MEIYTSDSSESSDSREQKTLDYGHLSLSSDYIEDDILSMFKADKPYEDIETVHLNHNMLINVPLAIAKFTNLKILDLSSNSLTSLPDILAQCPLTTLIAKNNLLTNASLPKTFSSKLASGGQLKELNLSGNKLQYFPEQVLELKQLKYLYLGGNQIRTIVKDIGKMQNLHLLSLGGNQLTDVPESVGKLSHLQALVLCDNLIENIPSSIAKLKNLKSLLIHRNRLKHLPREIISLKNLSELSIRDNPLIDRFVRDMTLSPPSLMELAGRAVKITAIPYGKEDLPATVLEYLSSANCCVNPKCGGVFFDNRVEHIKFVDFCGKYKIPLLQFLCSSKCVDIESKSASQRREPQPGASGYMLKKVLLG